MERELPENIAQVCETQTPELLPRNQNKARVTRI